jgi:hypothetical protein
MGNRTVVATLHVVLAEAGLGTRWSLQQLRRWNVGAGHLRQRIGDETEHGRRLSASRRWGVVGW